MSTILISKYKKLSIEVKASLWFMICSFLQKGLSVITTPIFTRLMSTNDYGRYNVFYSWIGVITTIVTLELHAGVYTQGLIKYDDDRDVFSSSLQGLTITLVIIWSGIYFIFHDFFNAAFSLDSRQVIMMLLIIWTTSVFGFWSTRKRVELAYPVLVKVTIISSFLSAIISILLVYYLEDKMMARIYGIVIVQLIFYIPCFVSQLKQGKTFYSAYYWRYALAFNLPLVPHYLSQTVLNSADRIMIEKMVGASEAGIYSLAYSISNLMLIVNIALLYTLNPWIYRKIKDQRVEEIAKIVYPLLLIIGLANLVLIAFAPELVHLFAPVEYYNAIWIIPPVSMSVYFLFTYSLFADFEFYYKKTVYIMIASMIGAIFNIVLNFVFIDLFGYLAAGYTTLLCYVFYALAHYCFMMRVCKEKMNGVKPYDPKILLGISLSMLLVSFIFTIGYKYCAIRYVMLILIAVVLIVKRTFFISSIRKILYK